MEEHGFGWALDRMRAEEKVCRRAWSNEGWYVRLFWPLAAITEPFFMLEHSPTERVVWTPTSQDLLANDWEAWGC